jgi:hypothetical protein
MILVLLVKDDFAAMQKELMKPAVNADLNVLSL